MKCLNCNNEINDNSNFCEFCGYKVEKNIPKNLFCTNCGNKLDGGNFCSSCGMKVNDNQLSTSISDYQSSNISNDNVLVNELNIENSIDNEQAINEANDSNNKKIVLNVIREKKTMGFAVPFTVHVDGNVIGKLKNGCTISCNINQGKHVVNIESVEKNTIQEIIVNDNTNSVEIRVVAKMGFVAATAKIIDIIYK